MELRQWSGSGRNGAAVLGDLVLVDTRVGGPLSSQYRVIHEGSSGQIGWALRYIF